MIGFLRAATNAILDKLARKVAGACAPPAHPLDYRGETTSQLVLDESDTDDAPPVGTPAVTFSPRAIEMRLAAKRLHEARRAAAKPAPVGPRPGSIEWRVQQLKRT